MSVVFAVRGTAKKAIYSGGLGTPTELGTNSVDAGAGTGIIGNSIINLDQGSVAQHSLAYEGRNNIPAGQQFSILMRCAPGTTGTAIQMFSVTLPYNAYGFQARFSGAGTIVATYLDSAGSTNATQTYSFAYVAGTYYDLVWLLDTSLTTAALVLYKDGSSVASTNGSTRTAYPAQYGSLITLGSQNAAAQNSTQIKLNECVIWNTIIDPTSVALTSGTGSLNGASRTAFVDVTTFEGGNYVYPGASDIRSGVAGLINAGTAVTPSLVVPTLANTKTGVAGDGGTGTYDGSDRWTDPGQSNVKSGVAYKANSTTNNKTGTLTGGGSYSWGG